MAYNMGTEHFAHSFHNFFSISA